MNPPPSPRLFLITGVSTGLGRAFAQETLAAGHRVIGTVRTPDALRDFEALAPGRALGRIVELRDTRALAPLVQELERSVGAIEVLINNAGYGHEGTMEESPLEELRDQFEVNVFANVELTRAVLPFMRQRRRGHILVVTSMGGLITLPGISYYHGSKFALEGLYESLGKEVKPFGIHVTNVEPGGFRTDWAGRSMVRSERRVPDYDVSFGPVREGRQQRHGRQPGDPAKAARAVLAVLDVPEPPTHLLLGADAVELVRAKLELLRKEIDAYEQLSRSTGF